MSSANYALIREAIAQRQQVWAVYNGIARKMCPHVIGHTDGVERGLFYQFEGDSSGGRVLPGSDLNWRCLPIAGLLQVEVQNGAWHTATVFPKKQSCVAQVDLVVGAALKLILLTSARPARRTQGNNPKNCS